MSEEYKKTVWIDSCILIPHPGMVLLGYGYYRAKEDSTDERDGKSFHIVIFDPEYGWRDAYDKSSMIISKWAPIFDPDGDTCILK